MRAFHNDPERFRISVAENLRKAREIIRSDSPDLIITDYNLPDGNGTDILSRRDDGVITIPLIVMTGFGDEHLAVEIMKSGAIDYVVKSGAVFEDMPHIARRAFRYWENIRQRRLAEEAVQVSRKNLADILSFLPDPVLAIDSNGRVIAWNNAMEGLTGVPAENMLGKGDHEYSIPFYGVRRPILVDLVLMSDAEIETKYDYILRNDSRITSETFIQGMYNGRGAYLWGTAAPLFDAAGNRTGAIEVIRDITDRKKTEVILQESETRFRDLFNNMRAGVAIYEPTPDGEDFIIRDINRAVETIEQVKKDEIVGKRILEIFPGVREFGIFDVFQRVAKTGIAESFPVSLYRDNRIAGWRENYVYKLRSGEVVALYEDVTDKKQAEDALRESELRCRTVIENAAEGMAVIQDGTIKFVNPRMLEMTQMNSEEIANRPFTDYIHPDDRALVFERYQHRISGENPPQHYDFRILGKDGKIIWVHLSAVRIVWDDKPATLNFLMDITDRKAAEDALRQSETRFRALIQNSSDIIRILDPDGRIVYESPSSERILGYLPGVMIGKKSLDFIHPADIDRVRHDLQEVFDRKNSSTPTEFRIRKADGEYIWVDSLGTNLLDIPGVDGIVITTRPVQQRKEAEQALHESEERLRLALEGADAGFWDWNLQTGDAVFSDRFFTMLGYQPGEFPSTFDGWSSLMHPDDRVRIIPAFRQQILEKRPLYEIEYRLMAQEGNWLWILGRGKIVECDEQGNPLRMTGVNIDITNRRLMESEIRSLNTVLEQRVEDRTEALSQANKALEEENVQRLAVEAKLRSSLDEKTLLLKEIHHRVKNNLQIIVSLLNLQSRYIKDEATLATIRESQNRVKAMALVHEKLYQAEDISHIDLNDYIRFLGTGLFQSYDARSRGIRFQLDISDVQVDINTAIPFGLIINELISNSLKYAFPEGRSGEISIGVKKEGQTLTAIFRDDGIGIPGELDWQNTQSLGLRLVNTLVDQLNGTIELDRTSGTRFTMVLHEKA
ncbi:MAG: PAS domain S-box protein [Methanoregula sp.]|nr:PAS domain S-box protein [Methanoregula sp.]